MRRNYLLSWWIGLAIVLAVVGFVAYRFSCNECGRPGLLIEFIVLGIVPIVYLTLMYMSFKSQADSERKSDANRASEVFPTPRSPKIIAWRARSIAISCKRWIVALRPANSATSLIGGPGVKVSSTSVLSAFQSTFCLPPRICTSTGAYVLCQILNIGATSSIDAPPLRKAPSMLAALTDEESQEDAKRAREALREFMSKGGKRWKDLKQELEG